MQPANNNVDPGESAPWHRILATFMLTLVCLGSFPATAGSTVAGYVLTGSVQATGKDQPAQTRKVAGGEAFMSGETLSTQAKPALIGFSDGTKMTLRPNTELAITAYRYGYGQGEALFDLNKGGIKVSTGKIAENDPSKFRVNTPYGDLSLPAPNAKGLACAEGCDYDVGQPKNSSSHPGHVAFSKGKVMITRGDHAPTAVKAGDILEKGNTVEVGRNGLAVLALANGQRRTLTPGKSYTIK